MIYIIFNQVNFLLAYLISIFFARALSLSDFGDFSYLKNILGLGLFIIWFGIDRSSLHLIKSNETEKVFVMNGIKLLVFAMLLFFSLFLININFININQNMIKIILLILFVSVIDIKYMFDIRKKIQFEILLNFFKIIPIIALIIFSIFFNYKVSVIDYFIYYFYGYLLYILSQYLFLKIKLSFRFNLNEFNSIRKYSQFVFLGGVFSYLNNYVDSFMIMSFLGKQATGIYSSAYIIFAGLLSLTSIFIRFFVSNNLNVDFNADTTRKYVIKMFLFSSIISIIIFLISDKLLVYILGSKFLNAYNVLDILLLAFIIISISSIYGNLLITNGFAKDYMKSMFTALVVNIILNYLYVKDYGIEAAAITTVISAIITYATTYYYFKIKVLKWK